MRLLVLGLAVLFSGALAFGIVSHASKEAPAAAAEQSIYRINGNDDNGAKLRVSRGSTIAYEFSWPVAPPFPSDLKAEATGGLSAPQIFGVFHYSNGHPRIGAMTKSIQVVAQRKGEASVTVTYKRGDQKVEKTFKIEVE